MVRGQCYERNPANGEGVLNKQVFFFTSVKHELSTRGKKVL